MIIILISVGVFFCGCICASVFGAMTGLFPCIVGLLGFCVGVVRLLVKGFIRFWRWGTGRSQRDAVDEVSEDVLPEEEDQVEEERIDLEEVARMAELAVLRRIVAMLGEQEESSAVEKFPNDNSVIEEENDEDNFCDEEDEIEEEEEVEADEAEVDDRIVPALSEEEEEEAEFLEERIERLQKYLDHLYAKRDKLFALGTKESSRTWRGNEYDIQYAQRELANHKAELKELYNYCNQAEVLVSIPVSTASSLP